MFPQAIVRACAVIALIACALLAEGKFYGNLGDLPPGEQYDFLIVGSGPGGATVASRLSEDPKLKVLLVEAGPNNEDVLQLQVPGLFMTINKTYNWNYVSTPQKGLNNRRLPYARGHVLGGSSSINAMVYTRGSRDDYDSWAKITGDKGWKWDNLVQYFKKNEKWTLSLPPRDISGQYDPAVHGYKGNLKTSLPSIAPARFDELALEVAQGQSSEFPFTLDYNGGVPMGLGWAPYTVGSGERSSAATSYLPGNVRKRPNLSIVVNTYALRVLPTGRGKNLDLRTVELGVLYSKQPTVKITARKEVILAGGAFGTPQILLNSGIGDRAELQAAGVAPIHHLRNVGKGMSDHVTVFATFGLAPTPGEPSDPIDPLEQWKYNRTGPLSVPFDTHHILWSKIPSNSSIWRKHKDPSPGKDAPHIEIIPVTGDTGVGTAAIILLSPHSRGSVTINSADAFADPLIDLGFLTHDFDFAALKEGFKQAERFLSHPAWDGFIRSPLSPSTDDPLFENRVREVASGLWHPVGTAAMSAKGDEGGVVDPDLKVKGVKGLRIVDASVFPYVPAAHTQVPVYVLAERAADLIKAEWKI